MGKVFGVMAVLGAAAGGFVLSGGNPIVAGKAAMGAAALFTTISGSRQKPRALLNSSYAPAPPIATTMEENLPIPLIYGQVKTSGNVIQGGNNNLHVAFAEGEINAYSDIRINNVPVATVKDDDGNLITYDMYYGGTTQTEDSRLDITGVAAYKQSYRNTAYIAFTFPTTLQVSAGIPNVTATIAGKKCRPLTDLSAGTPVYTRNPAVIMADFAINVKKYSAASIDTTSFQALETYCNAIPTGGTLPRYRLDYAFIGGSIADAQAIIESAFLGRLIRSQGTYKVVYESSAASVFDFTEDNIVHGSLSWRRRMRKNIIRVHFLNSTEEYRPDVVEIRDEESITLIGDQVFEEHANYITDAEIAQRRAQYWLDKFKYSQIVLSLTGFPVSAKLEILDVVTVTHDTPGYSSKLFMVLEKSQDEFSRPVFVMEEYNTAIYGDYAAAKQTSATTTLPNAFDAPDAPTAITCTTAYKLMDDNTYMPQIQVDWTAASSVFSLEYEIWIRWGSVSTFFHGKTAKVTYTFDAPQPTTYYVKLRTVNVATNVKSDFTAETSHAVVHQAIDPLDGFTIVSEFSTLESYPLSLRREIIKEIQNRYDPTSGSKFVPVVITDFQFTTQPVKDIRVKLVLPRDVSGTQQMGDGTASGNTLTDTVNNYVSGSVIGNYIVSFSTDSDDGTEHKIINVASDGGIGTVFTVTGTPQTGKYFLVSANDIV